MISGFTGALLARAGGGHSFGGGGFSGGGGGLSGGGGGGGGGVFFFGGGGGGGGSALGIVVVLVIVLLLFAMFGARRRRRWGGGRSSGTSGSAGAPASRPPSGPGWNHDDRPAIDSVRGDLFPGTAPAAHSGGQSSAEGLAAIRAHDPGFEEEAFLEQVQRAFFVVQEAWSERQPDLSRQVMADALWQQHRVQIQGYLSAHKRNVLEDLAVGDLTIIAAHTDQTYDTVTVRVRAACADYDVDDESGRVVRGDRRVEEWREDWTFQRSSKAKTQPRGGTLSEKCPNCGAPLDLDLAGVCKFCKAPVMSGDYDWVLSRISQVPAAY